jgi:membrane protein YdbS with pleckstrin-like domain
MSELALLEESEGWLLLDPNPSPRCERTLHVDAMIDAALVFAIAFALAYGAYALIARYRWWAVAVWLGINITLPLAILGCRAVAER